MAKEMPELGLEDEINSCGVLAWYFAAGDVGGVRQLPLFTTSTVRAIGARGVGLITAAGLLYFTDIRLMAKCHDLTIHRAGKLFWPLPEPSVEERIANELIDGVLCQDLTHETRRRVAAHLRERYTITRKEGVSDE